MIPNAERHALRNLVRDTGFARHWLAYLRTGDVRYLAPWIRYALGARYRRQDWKTLAALSKEVRDVHQRASGDSPDQGEDLD